MFLANKCDSPPDDVTECYTVPGSAVATVTITDDGELRYHQSAACSYDIRMDELCEENTGLCKSYFGGWAECGKAS